MPTTNGLVDLAATHTLEFCVHDDQGVRSSNLGQGRTYGLDEVASVVLLDQMDQHLGIGFGDELVPGREQPLLKGQKILDDSVVHHRQPPVLGQVRVGIHVGRFPVGGPAGMSDTEATE